MKPSTLIPSLALILGLSSLACDNDNDNSINDDDKGSASDPLVGQFQTRGYGYTLVSDGHKASLYESTSISCLKVLDSAVKGLELTDLEAVARFEGDTLIIQDEEGLYLEADRLASLPAPCQDSGTKATQDALVNFDILAATFNEHYAFFDLHGIDWPATTASHRARLSATSSTDQFFDVTCEMLASLNDGHVSMGNSTRGCSGEPADPELQTHMEGLANYFENVLKSGEGVTTDANKTVAYRRLAPGIGYLLISQMYVDDVAAAQQTEVMGAAIDRAIAALGDAGHLIVDLRANPGGTDAVSLAIAGRFTEIERVAYSKKARNGSGFTTERTVSVRPLGARTYQGKVWLITSRFTASAAEIFALAMRVNPNVTLIGENTAGVFSDIFARQLPNGVYVGLSNEIYTAADGQIYEGRGVPPTIPVAFSLAELAAGEDGVLRTTLSLAGAQP